ncbi:IS982 family transposase [Salmonella enterica]|nr:IS982 family transposase [Salmonella enterica]EDS5482503.1 IS982 family transposase [Salmonella enterica subsp. enterica serovar Panama]EGX9178962.1 IS982 family transposase [Salmonella enterica]EGZ6495587.1 IS982 family transposase [Salmonella enterica]EKA7109946.1 IS982 family transposase [Salmonella enterica]
MDYITELYCPVDDFWQSVKEQIDNYMISDDKKHRSRQSIFSLSEMTTLVILFRSMRFRQFKKFYQYVSIFIRREFPRLLSYNRFIELMPQCIVLLTVLFDSLKGSCTGVSVVDSTPLAVCDNLRISRHKVFDGYAERGKSSTGWFFGFKLHVIINHLGEIISARLTAGNVDDRKPVPDMASGIFGALFCDKGYLSNSLKEKLKDMGINFITKVRRNMKKVKHTDFEKAVLSKRSVIETVFDELKNLYQIEHSRYRSINNFIVNLLSGPVAYCLMDKKPNLSISTSAPVLTA